MKEFLTSEDYLGNSVLEITYTSDNITGHDLYNACVRALEKVSSHVISIKQEFVGTKEFEPKMLRNVLKDKKIFLSNINSGGGKGESQISCVNAEYQLNLLVEHWYVFNDNYGTNEEKLFIKYFKTDIEPKLKEKNLEYYVIRNERIPDLALYSFEAGERFEPDFLLFVRKKGVSSDFNYQVYIEPKGNQLLSMDSWKEEFLMELEEKHKINSIVVLADSYKIIGLPFFNQENRRNEFGKVVDDWIRKL